MELNDWKADFPAIAASLEKARARGRAGQAYLFVGDHAERLMTFAKGWALTAACAEPDAEGRACGKCPNCRLALHGNYPELYVLAPLSKSRIITIDAIREFDHKLSLSAPRGMLKVGIISEAECLGQDAQNAFLKTLEEPPANTMLLLLTTRPKGLLPIIRSRCQNVLMLRNRTDYREAVPAEFLALLPKLRRGAGTQVAFAASAAMGRCFSALRAQAEENVRESWDPQWDEVAANDKSIAKQLEETRVTKIETEYMRLRTKLLETIQAWFQQRYLMAAGVPKEALPQPEFLEVCPTAPDGVPSIAEAEEGCRAVETFIASLRANVEEGLCLDALCLEICRKS